MQEFLQNVEQLVCDLLLCVLRCILTIVYESVCGLLAVFNLMMAEDNFFLCLADLYLGMVALTRCWLRKTLFQSWLIWIRWFCG